MKFSMASLSFLTLAAVLGTQAQVINETGEPLMVQHQPEPTNKFQQGVCRCLPNFCRDLASVAHPWVSLDTQPNPGEHVKQRDDTFLYPSDCCFSYTPRSIQCASMRDCFLTSSGCPTPGVIFITKKGKLVCANPKDQSVKKCMKMLKSCL